MMKILISILFFLSTQLFAEPMSCSESATLLLVYKLKNIGTMRAADFNEGKKRTAANNFKCSYLKDEDWQNLEEDKKQKTKLCRLGDSAINGEIDKFDESMTLGETIALNADFGLGNEECLKDKVVKDISSLVSASTKKSVKSLCQSFAPIYNSIFSKAEYCEKAKAAENDPNTCEIADENGLCPEQNQTNEPTSPERKASQSEDDSTYKIKWTGGAVQM